MEILTQQQRSRNMQQEEDNRENDLIYSLPVYANIHVVNLDEERKAAMVSNLLVVLCGNRDVQPIVNSGSIY